MTARFHLVAGCLLAAAAVALGAYGAHGLDKQLDQILAEHPPESLDQERHKRLENWHTAVRYHMDHALGLVLAGLLAGGTARGCQHCAAAAFLLGIALFSGGLYVYVLGGPPAAVHVVPFGGVAFIIGWLTLVLATLRGSGT